MSGDTLAPGADIIRDPMPGPPAMAVTFYPDPTETMSLRADQIALFTTELPGCTGCDIEAQTLAILAFRVGGAVTHYPMTWDTAMRLSASLAEAAAMLPKPKAGVQ